MKIDLILRLGKGMLDKMFPFLLLSAAVAFIMLVIPVFESTVTGTGTAKFVTDDYTLESKLTTVEERDDNIYGLKLATTDTSATSKINLFCKSDNILVTITNTDNDSIVNSSAYVCKSGKSIVVEVDGTNGSLIVSRFTPDIITSNTVYRIGDHELYGNSYTTVRE